MEFTVRSARTFAALALAVAVAATVAADGSLGTWAPEAPARAELRAVSTRLDGTRSTVLIEASEPVAYVTSQPDPLTVLVDLRNVRGGQMGGVLGPLPPVANVDVEEAVAGDGAPVARIRVTLAHAATHRVRSSRNMIFVEVDRAAVPHDALSAAARPDSDDRAPEALAATATLPAPLAVNPLAQRYDALTPSAAVARLAQQPAPAAPAPGISTSGQPTAQRFTGEPVTLDFQGADLRAVLRNFAEISGLNVVIDPSITGTVDVSLRDVPWDQALDIILKANKLGYAVDGTVVRIAPLVVLAQEEDERRKLSDAKALSGELGVLTLPLSYAKAPELVSILTRSALSSRGEVQVDSRTNTLIVRDLQERLTSAAELVRTLDRPQPQVEIEARIVQTTRDFARAIGVEWGFNGRVDSTLGNTPPIAFPNNGAIRGDLGSTTGPGGTSTGVDLRAPAPSSAVGIALGAINGAFNLDVALSALESSGRGRLLSTPRVSTQNNVEAEMTQGVQIPIQTVANNTVTVSFKDAALTLRVTPQITASNTVIMRVFLENATPDFSRAVNGIPPIDTQRAVTTVLVADGETTVIGGIYVSLEQASNDRVPLMHRVPLLGWLFKRDTMSDESRELLIFITPRITKG
jgi:type IV pilus secretin PilQ/predicted competence protein